MYIREPGTELFELRYVVLTFERSKTPTKSLFEYLWLGPVPKCDSGQIFLVRSDDFWYITDDFLWDEDNDNFTGFFRLESEG